MGCASSSNASPTCSQKGRDRDVSLQVHLEELEPEAPLHVVVFPTERILPSGEQQEYFPPDLPSELLESVRSMRIARAEAEGDAGDVGQAAQVEDRQVAWVGLLDFLALRRSNELQGYPPETVRPLAFGSDESQFYFRYGAGEPHTIAARTADDAKWLEKIFVANFPDRRIRAHQR